MFTGTYRRPQMYDNLLLQYDPQNVTTETDHSAQSSFIDLQQYEYPLAATMSEQNLMSSAGLSEVSLLPQSDLPQTFMPWQASTQSFGVLGDTNDQEFYSNYSPSTIDSPYENVNLRSPLDLEIPRFLPSQRNSTSYSNKRSSNVQDYTAYEPWLESIDDYSNISFRRYFDTSRHGRSTSTPIRESPTVKRERQDFLPVADSLAPASSIRLAFSEESSDTGLSSREMTAAVEDETTQTDEPYAKLIYRALMSKPDHSMVLQEIYQWFRENTVKGSSDSKGWMNSIRHNLSMNAAFKKTERRVPGDDSKKSTEWVLEPFAVKDGVQSTTRYRKGTGTKKPLCSETTAPSLKSLYGRGTMSKLKAIRSSVSNRSTDIRVRKVDRGRKEHLQQDVQQARGGARRRRSPVTPPQNQLAQCFNDAGNDASGMNEGPVRSPLPCGMRQEYAFEDTQGLYLGSTFHPLFYDGGEVHFHHGLPDSPHC